MARRARPLRSSAAAVAFFPTLVPALVIACARVAPVAPQAPPAHPADVPSDVEQLRGLPASELARHFGEPDFVREEPPAVVWQYRGTDCVLDLFFYRDGGELRVAYAEARDRALARVSQSDCYADLVARRARPL
jgi:hypothetical protein